jgi:hypothetical protein
VTYVIDKAAPTLTTNHQYSIPVIPVDESPYLVINRIPLGHQHTVNSTPLTRPRRRRKVTQGAIEFGELVDSLVANERFSHENDPVRIIDRNQLMAVHTSIHSLSHHGNAI